MVERFGDHDWDRSGQIPEDEDPVYRNQADHGQHVLTLQAMDRAGITVSDLWLHYLSMGGDIDEYEVDAYLHGLMRLSAVDRDMIAQAVNELIDDIARGPRAPFSAGRSNTTSGADTDNDAGTDNDTDSCTHSAIGTNTDGEIGIGGGWGLFEYEDVFDRFTPAVGMATGEQVLSVVYSSAATRFLSDADLGALLTSSRRTNHYSHLTGLLLYRGGRFLQVLEGPAATVRDRMAIIRADPRHDRLRVLVDETKDQRQFPAWDMRYGSIGPAMSRYVSGYEKLFADAENGADPVHTRQVVRELIRWFQDHPSSSR